MSKEHFNQLTPAQAERLAMLAEEAGEIIQVVGKILRHGYESCHPGDPEGPNNRELLEEEMSDFHAVTQMMIAAGDGDFPQVSAWLNGRIEQKMRYSHHQDDAQ